MTKGDILVTADLQVGVVILEIKLINKMFPEGVTIPLGVMPFAALTIAKMLIEQSTLILEPKGTLPE